MNLSYIFMMIFTNYYLILLSMGVFGLGDGLANLSVIKNCWKYYPDKLGLVNGIIIGGLGLSSSILTPIADYLIINPDKKPTDDKGIYPKEESNKLKNYLYFLAVLFFILSIAAVCLTFNYQEDDPSKVEELDDVQRTHNKGFGVLYEAFFAEKNYFLLLFCFCGPCN